MEAIEAIFTRRSIRKYTSEAVSSEKLDLILRAAMSAPSANNLQPWQFIVIDDQQVLRTVSARHPYAKMLTEAAFAIAVCGDKILAEGKDNWMLDCSAASQNILLAAHALGLGAVWISVFPYPERISILRESLDLPEFIIPVSLLSIGVPGEVKPPENRFNPNKIHKNKW